MLQLILQDCHVAYREIETTLGLSRTSIHSILHEQLIAKKNLFALNPTQFVNRSKNSINRSGKSASTIGSNAFTFACIELNWEYFEKQESDFR